MVSFFSEGHNYAPYITYGTSKWGFCFDTGKRRTVPELKFEHDGCEQREGVSLIFGDKRKARASNGKRHGFAQQVPRADFESWMMATNRIRIPQAAIIRPQARSVQAVPYHLIYEAVRRRWTL
jgi:hypothetical protein